MGIIEVTAATSIEQPEFLVTAHYSIQLWSGKEQRVWKDRVIPGPVEVSAPDACNCFGLKKRKNASEEKPKKASQLISV